MNLWKKLKEFFKPVKKVVQKNTPLILRTSTVNLPAWAKISDKSSDKVSIIIEADTDAFMQEWLKILGVTEPDQYWIEVAYQCAKMDLQTAIENTQFDPRYSGKPAEFRFSSAPVWVFGRYQVGKGIGAASQGKEARGHYKRIRGKLPLE